MFISLESQLSHFHSRKGSGSMLMYLIHTFWSFPPNQGWIGLKMKEGFHHLKTTWRSDITLKPLSPPQPSQSSGPFLSGLPWQLLCTCDPQGLCFPPGSPSWRQVQLWGEGKGNCFLLPGDTALSWSHKYGINFDFFFLNLRYLTCQHAFKKNFIKVKELELAN